MADDPIDSRLVEAGRAARLVAAACGATLAQADAAQSAAVEVVDRGADDGRLLRGGAERERHGLAESVAFDAGEILHEKSARRRGCEEERAEHKI